MYRYVQYKQYVQPIPTASGSSFINQLTELGQKQPICCLNSEAFASEFKQHIDCSLLYPSTTYEVISKGYVFYRLFNKLKKTLITRRVDNTNSKMAKKEINKQDIQS